MTRRAWPVLKLGGELVETPERLAGAAAAIARAPGPYVIVHGGGREIDAALARAGIPRRQVDGLRVTDADTLGIVVDVLAGGVNTRFVAALVTAGVRAVGLTGADAGAVRVDRAAPLETAAGATVDLGYVGEPRADGDAGVLDALCQAGYVPVVASLGLGADGAIYNVNADTMAAHVAARLGASRLVIAGGTPGVLDENGGTIPRIDGPSRRALLGNGVATAGMIAKLRACERALESGVAEVLLVDGRDPDALAWALDEAAPAPASNFTRVVR
jgi:acetylglutamate kinase